MDSMKREKLRVMRKYKRTNFLQNLFQYCVTAYVFGKCFSKAFPSLFDSFKFFFFPSLSYIGAFLVGPKCLFILCIMILIFILSESKLMSSSASSPETDIYDEYVKHSRSRRRLPASEGKAVAKKLELTLSQHNVEMIKEVVEEVKEMREEEEKEEISEEEAAVEEEVKEEENRGEDLDGEEEVELPLDELNRRVEDFIAKVNKQRKLEADMMICSG